MVDKSKLREFLIIIFFILVISLFLLIIFVCHYLFDKKDIKRKTKDEIITKTYNLDDVQYLKFNFRNSTVYYKRTNNDKLIIKQYESNNNFYINKERKFNSLSFKEQYSNSILKKVYKVYIPKRYQNNIYIINGFGNIKIENFDNNIKINNNSGNINIGKLSTLNIKNVSGNIKIRSIKTNIKGTSSTGNIIVKSIEGQALINTITGDIRIDKFLILDDSTIETTSGNIDIDVSNKSLCRLVIDSDNRYNKISKKVCSNGENILKIKNVTGQVSLK